MFNYVVILLQDVDTFELQHLEFKTLAQYDYLLPGSIKYLYLYHFAVYENFKLQCWEFVLNSCFLLLFLTILFLSINLRGSKSMYGLFLPMNKHAYIYVLDTVRSNQMPNMVSLYNAERNSKCVHKLHVHYYYYVILLLHRKTICIFISGSLREQILVRYQLLDILLKLQLKQTKKKYDV